MFKGYGKMGLKVFHEYREKIVYYANKEVHERLVRALERRILRNGRQNMDTRHRIMIEVLCSI